MRAVLSQLPGFVAKWRRLGLTDEDLQALEWTVMENPTAGPVMKGTGGLRKIRFAPPSWHTGKSGAARVCYAAFAAYDRVYFVTIFAKSEQANLTEAERNDIAQLLRRLGDALAAGTNDA